MRSQLDRRIRRFAICTGLALTVCLSPQRAAAQGCVGDCDGDLMVTLGELIVGVNIALGTSPITDCERLDANGDEQIAIDELIAAVSQSFSPCATPTPTTTHTTTPTVTPTGTHTPTGTATSSLTSTPTETDTPTATPTASETGTTTPTATPTAALLRRASKSGAIALSGDESVLVMVNPDDNSVSIFRTEDNTLFAKLATGAEPSAVVVHPDDTTAFVANRAGATVVKITNIKSSEPAIAATAQVGSEPTALALSPAGDRLFVAEWAEGRVSVIDTERMMMVGSIDGLRNPRAVAVTNDGDADGSDEMLVVTEFFGTPNDDASECPNGTAEVCDTGRIGRLLRFDAGNLTPLDPIDLAPLASGFEVALPAGTAAVMTSPNQLYAATIQGDKAYVTSVSASPEAPIRFDLNVYPVVYVADLATDLEDRSSAGTANLAKLAEDAVQPGATRFFLQEIVDLDFDGSSTTAYVVSRAADVLQRVDYDPVTGITIGTEEVTQIDLAGCQNPIGVAVASALRRAYVNCWINGRLGIVDLEAQSLAATVPAVDLPSPGTAEDDVRLGKRFFFTGRGRWSEGGEGYSSCGSCHPDGLSDGITWAFAAGPRQTTSLDGSFSHGTGPQKQRIFNWTAIFDETHDFERNTRGVSGGLGAITRSPSGECGNVLQEEQLAISADGLGQPVKAIQDEPPGACTDDWDKIDAFLQTVRPPRARLGLDLAAVERGRFLFRESGACAVCHGGPGWTASRRYWTPSSANNAALQVTPFEPPTDDPFWPLHSVQIGPQPAAADTTGGAVGPNEVACVLRIAGTFGIPGDVTGTNLVELKANGQRAQGAGGFNIPSLYGLSVGAPYLHHGQARTLEELLGDPNWRGHLTAANPDFDPSPADIGDLVAFLLSIDADALEIGIPSGLDGCPSTFPAFVSALSGDQEVPVVDSDATGQAVFFLNADGTTLTYQVDIEGLSPEEITQAHLHVAPRGFNGPIVLFLASSSPAELPLRGNLRAADLQPNDDVEVSDFASFIEALEAGDAYVNVHTSDHPDGEIRGQVRVPTAFVAELSGDQEVPPVATKGSGRAMLRLSADEQTLEYRLILDDVDPERISQAHLHVAPRGFNGPVVLFLTAGPPRSLPLEGVLGATDLLPAPDAGVVDFADFVEALRAGDVYANVHTDTHPAGEIRGQVQAAIELPAFADGGGDTSGRARFVLGPDRSTLRFALQTTGLTSDQIEGADLHVAPPGFEGPAVLSLADDGFAPIRIATLDGGDLLPNAEAGIETFPDLVDALLAGDAYANVRTETNPAGELRAQIDAPILFPVTLGGDQVVPPVSTEASGRGQIVLGADESALRFALEVQGLARLSVAETLVNDAPPGQNGPTVFFLAEAGFNNPLVGTLTPEDFCIVPCPGVGGFDDFLGDLKAGNAYMNVTTLDEPDGEIRGQAEAPLAFTATLGGDQVVPPVVTAAGGQARVVLSSDSASLRFAIAVDSLDAGMTTGAAIHVGGAGANGPAVFVLAGGAFAGPLIGPLDATHFLPAPGVVDTFDAFVAELLAGRSYVNVTTMDQPDGEIRGQLVVEP